MRSRQRLNLGYASGLPTSWDYTNPQSDLYPMTLWPLENSSTRSERFVNWLFSIEREHDEDVRLVRNISH